MWLYIVAILKWLCKIHVDTTKFSAFNEVNKSTVNFQADLVPDSGGPFNIKQGRQLVNWVFMTNYLSTRSATRQPSTWNVFYVGGVPRRNYLFMHV